LEENYLEDWYLHYLVLIKKTQMHPTEKVQDYQDLKYPTWNLSLNLKMFEMTLVLFVLQLWVELYSVAFVFFQILKLLEHLEIVLAVVL